MAAVGQKHRVVLETSAGDVYEVPVYGLDGQPAPVSLQPIDPFDQVSIIGDTAKALDRRADQIVAPDQRGGAGRLKYKETEGVTDYRQSDADPRHEGATVCRPKRTSLGIIPAFGLDPNGGANIIHTGITGAVYHSWSPNVRIYYHPGVGTVWTQCTGLTVGALGYVQAFGYIYAVSNAGRLWRSANGIAFTQMMAAASATGIYIGLAAHDNKLWTIETDSANGVVRLLSCVDPTNPVPTAATWTQVASYPMVVPAVNENPINLFVWKDASGSPALFVYTGRRILAYNPVGGTLEEYDDFSENNPEGRSLANSAGVVGIHFKTTGDLYFAQGPHNDYLMRYTPGAGFGKVTPNREGGLEKIRQGSPRTLAQNAYGLGVWTMPTSVVGTVGGGGGGAWFLTPEGGWHCLNRDLAGARYVIGGGIGNRKFFTVFDNGLVEEQDLPLVASRPQFAVSRKYDTSAGQIHEYARTDFGSEGTRFDLLGFTLVTVKSDGTDQYGLDAAASLKVEYNLNGGGWTTVTQYKDTAGTIRTLAGSVVTAAQTSIGFPVRLVVNNEFGVVAYDLAWRVTLTTSNEDQTPVLVYCAPRGKKTPPPHYRYEFVVDVMDFQNASSLAQGGVMGLPGGRPGEGLHQTLESLDQLGTMVKITYGIGHQQRSDMCEFAMAPQLHPTAGVGRYRISLNSVAADNSG